MFTHVNVKRDFVGCIERKYVPNIVFLAVQGSFGILLLTYVLTKFNASITSIMQGSQSIFVVIFAFIMLGERLSLFSTFSILLGFGALAMIIFGNSQALDPNQF